ncbi:Uncharacterized protein HZ326_11923 [Fusarium oxysporum f. sp. albedinis]|nr:Uncharacterized protein HZ326_11923 [Fusarium oxysporum f. sp. albedinis]
MGGRYCVKPLPKWTQISSLPSLPWRPWHTTVALLLAIGYLLRSIKYYFHFISRKAILSRCYPSDHLSRSSPAPRPRIEIRSDVSFMSGFAHLSHYVRCPQA